MRRARGFTLLEVLIGLALFSLVLLVLGGAARFVSRASLSQNTAAASSDQFETIDRVLRGVLAGADPGTPKRPALRGSAADVAFIGTLPAGAGTGGPAGMVLLLNENHVLGLRWAPVRYGIPLGPAPAPQWAELVSGVDRLELSYWKGSWRREWTEPTLPTLVRVRIGFASGDRRHWPDIVVRLARSFTPSPAATKLFPDE